MHPEQQIKSSPSKSHSSPAYQNWQVLSASNPFFSIKLARFKRFSFCDLNDRASWFSEKNPSSQIGKWCVVFFMAGTLRVVCSTVFVDWPLYTGTVSEFCSKTFLDQQNILSDMHFGFCKSRFWKFLLTFNIQDPVKELNNSIQIDVVSWFFKAFHEVPHHLLAKILQY